MYLYPSMWAHQRHVIKIRDLITWLYPWNSYKCIAIMTKDGPLINTIEMPD